MTHTANTKLTEPPQTRCDRGKVYAELALAITEHGLAAPISLEAYTHTEQVTMRMEDNDPDAVQRWARHLGLGGPILGSRVFDATDRSAWRSYSTDDGMTATGPKFRIWSAIDVGEARDLPERFVHPDLGPMPGYVVGRCGHRVAESEWRAGFRECERCPRQDGQE